VASPLQIRPYEPADLPAVWALLEPVFRAGETFPHEPAITQGQAQVAWVEKNQAVMVAVDAAGAVVGTYYLRPNSLCLGAHVANAGYVVAEHCRRQGVGSRLCQHSLLAAQWLSSGRHSAGSVSPHAAGLRRCLGDDPGACGGAYPMKVVPLRLHPGDDLRQALETWLGEQQELAGCVISGIGSLSVVQLRFAGAAAATTIHGELEILSLSGTLSADGAHLHIAIADNSGAVIGGHLYAGSLVRTTAELVIGLLPEWRFSRELDTATGYAELRITPRSLG